jgi:hypothetical protein
MDITLFVIKMRAYITKLMYMSDFQTLKELCPHLVDVSCGHVEDPQHGHQAVTRPLGALTHIIDTERGDRETLRGNYMERPSDIVSHLI